MLEFNRWKAGVRGWLLKNKNRLPKVKLYIEKMEESHEDFQIRKIKMAIIELQDEGANVSKWNVVKKSGVNVKYIEKMNNKVIELLGFEDFD